MQKSDNKFWTKTKCCYFLFLCENKLLNIFTRIASLEHLYVFVFLNREIKKKMFILIVI